MIYINSFDHYWVIGGSATQVYSSKTNTMVPMSDSDYVAWAAAYSASPIASEAELATTVRANGSPLPDWLFNAPSFIQPAPGVYDNGQLKAYAADARYRYASGGVVVTSLSSVAFLSDPVSRNTVNSAWNYATQKGAGYSVQWKMSDGSFIVLNEAQLTTLANDMAGFVQSCFACESTTGASIDSGTITTLAQIDAAFAAISNVFP